MENAVNNKTVGRWGEVPGWIREATPPYAMAPACDVALRILADRFGDRDHRDRADHPNSRDRREPGHSGGACGGASTRDGERGGIELAGFQANAVRRAERILAERRGVVVADSVGLGKTYIALALIERAVRSGGRVAVFTPAALRREWTTSLRRLARAVPGTATYGLGSDARGGRPFLAWLSHERLSRGTYPHALLEALDLIVVDEAHAFRSPSTRRYRALAALARGARVILLTATPVNNSVWDLYFQLHLFAGDGAFRDVGIADLKEAFRGAAGEGSGAAALAPVLREVVIRRTRPYLRERYGNVRLPGSPGALGFPRRAPPIPIRYALEGTIDVDDIIATIEAITWATLSPERYRVGAFESSGIASSRSGAWTTRSATGSAPSGGASSDSADRAASVRPAPYDPNGVAALLRAGLLKRLESSVAAFTSTVRRQIRFHDAFLRALDRGRVLAPADRRALYDAGGDGDPLQLVLEEVVLAPVPPGTDLERLRADATSDRERLIRMLHRTDGRPDPKLQRLNSLLDHELRECKVVLFTEFRDTARYLWRALVCRGHVALVDGAGAFLGERRSSRRAVIDRFAPRSNRVRPPPDRERVDLLIATDVLAEGLNLQDAGRLVSYDLPWNPVRLIQRVGRIDRIGSPHPVVYAYPFLPDRGLERALRLLDRLRGKLAAIGRTIGHEAAVLDEQAAMRDRCTDDRGGYRGLIERLAAGDPDALDAIERADAAPFELEDRLHTAYHDAVMARGPDYGMDGLRATDARRASVAAPPTTAVRPTVATPPTTAACFPTAPGTPHRVLVAHRIAHRPHWAVVTFADPDADGTHANEDVDGAAEILLAVLEGSAPRTEKGAALWPHATAPDRCVPSHSILRRALDAVRPLVAERVAHLEAATQPLPHTTAGASAARTLLAALAAVPGGPDAPLCDRADRILAALALRHDAGTEVAIRDATAAASGTPAGAERAHALLDALESILPCGAASTAMSQASPTPAPAPRSADHIQVELIGVIEARPISVRGIATDVTG